MAENTLRFAPDFVRALISEGFLPICAELGGGTGLFVLLPKLHERRCILRFDTLHTPKKLRRRALRQSYTLTVGDSYDAVLAGCLRQHSDSWLHPPLCAALAAMRSPSGGAVARTLSFALWRGEQLVAGEIGAVTGSVYTSFTGFHAADGAGAAQIALTARLLERAGFAFWDMGQEHEYKLKHGAIVVSRCEFLDAFRRGRCRPSCLQLGAGSDAVFGAEELFASIPCASGGGIAGDAIDAVSLS